MKTTIPISIKIVLTVFCLFILGNTYSQDQKQTNKTLFGKPLKAGTINPNNGHIRCASTEYEQYLQGKDPKRMTSAQFEARLAPLIDKYKAMKTTSQSGGIITIPVVIHVIYDGEAIGVAPNITDAQVQSQITVLNQDYRKIAGTPGDNSNPVGADTQIQFELAKQDPNGNPTNGIDRVSLNQTSWSDIDIEATLKPATIWDPSSYMNMWSVKFTDNTLLGYAQFPDGSGLGGLNASGGASNTDGVVSNYDVFGSNDYNDGSFLLDATYNKGRTMSHEVGHWLGLIHIWGDSPCGDDYCADTPVHHDANYGCPTVVNCDANGNEMVENYMDYTDDACMNIFTKKQKIRITTIINNAARRSSLKTSTKNATIPLFANDAEVKLEAYFPTGICGAVAYQTIQNVTIYNRGTSNLTSATIDYNINGGSNIVYNWSGDLATNKSATFPITINSASNGTINITSISSANGGTDQRLTNNTASGTFIIPIPPSNYAYTSYDFRLQQDKYGSETTWSLKNGSGATLYSGGPYADKPALPLPELITETWILANNQCYTFTINDSVGDGICCGTSGDGYYDIKTNSGAIIVTSGSSYTSSASKTFTTNTLGTNKFETSNDIYLYPNPTKGTLNVRVPSDFGLPNSLTISNSLGQIVSRKEVSKENDLTINTSTLSNGVYFITVLKENQKKTLQFIKE
ncbi:T9SS type A sorting domain-containing protein [Flavobacterium soyangense]|uniref:T9SS type A sorting domain-containing protein n=1 Tax=Flavobacterium soyangense TaxID=2023265 RepID=A0A930XT54_9FLAO|nr:T9SS type A sorting domain-containing protein [Flavobacterium soyangense]MBF2707115.1 T9SS type A sorting domain-containing protein [Flavobacterium soyangense]